MEIRNVIIFSLIAFFYTPTLHAAPTMMSYQGRILKSNGKPLTYSNVSFSFQITSPNGQCILYEEQVSGLDLSESGGVFDAPIGTGTRFFPFSGSATVLDVLNNMAVSLPCKNGANFHPSVHDVRRLRVQFHDGEGWRQISPDSVIRTVPYSSFAFQASKVGEFGPEHLLIKNDIPSCTSNQFLSWDGAVLTCEPVVFPAVGSGSGSVAAGDDPRFTDSRVPTGAAGGALNGLYPDPGLAHDSVGTINILDSSVTLAKLAAGSAGGQVLRYSGAAWQSTKLNYADLVNSHGASPWPGSCGAGEYITWVSLTDGFACSALNIGNGANQIPQLDSGGKLNDSTLPASIVNGAWTSDGSGNVYRTSGNVGVGTSSPSAKLEVNGSVKPGGVTLGAACTPSGAQAHDSVTYAPVYCNASSVWTAVGGGAVPAGAVMSFDLAACPSGWSEYLPARGRFIRGIDNGAGNDPSGTRAPGSVQADDLKSHSHTYAVYYDNYGYHDRYGTDFGQQNGGQTWSTGATGGAETRPKNVALLYCKKN